MNISEIKTDEYLDDLILDVPYLMELVTSIDKHGLRRPLTIRESDKLLVDGRLRYLACKVLEKVDIPVHEIPMTDEQVKLQRMLSCNQRQRLRVKDYRHFFENLHERGRTIEEISRRTNFPPEYINALTDCFRNPSQGSQGSADVPVDGGSEDASRRNDGPQESA